MLFVLKNICSLSWLLINKLRSLASANSIMKKPNKVTSKTDGADRSLVVTVPVTQSVFPHCMVIFIACCISNWGDRESLVNATTIATRRPRQGLQTMFSQWVRLTHYTADGAWCRWRLCCRWLVKSTPHHAPEQTVWMIAVIMWRLQSRRNLHRGQHALDEVTVPSVELWQDRRTRVEHRASSYWSAMANFWQTHTCVEHRASRYWSAMANFCCHCRVSSDRWASRCIPEFQWSHKKPRIDQLLMVQLTSRCDFVPNFSLCNGKSHSMIDSMSDWRIFWQVRDV